MALTDLTRISTSGIATGTSLSGAILHGDAHFRGTQVGVTSALFDSSDNALEFNDDVKLKLGNSGDFEIYHRGADGVSIINETGSAYLSIGSNGDKVELYDTANSRSMAEFATGGACSFKHGSTIRFETSGSGAIVTGILTATGFSGPTNNTSGIATFYDLRVSNNLTVEGTTTTLDTNLIGVDRIEVGADSNTIVGVAVTQSGTADLVNLFDGATNVLTVTDTGDVGIGSEIPASRLDILNTGANADISLRSTANSFNSFIFDSARIKDTQFAIIDGRWNGNSVARIQFVTGSDDTNYDDGYMAFWTRTSGQSLAERLRITSAGKVGIGTNTPSQLVQIGGPGGDACLSLIRTNAASNNNAWGHVFFENSSDAVLASISARRESAADDAYLTFSTQSTGNAITEKLRITSTGTLTIKGSTTSDNYKMDLRVNDTQNEFRGSSNSTSHKSFVFYSANTNTSERLRIDSSGNVKITGITTTGSYFNSVSGYRVANHPVVGYVGFTAISGGSYAATLGSTGTSTLRHTQIYGGGSVLATFDGVNNRLGIGTQVPSQELTVYGADPIISVQEASASSQVDIGTGTVTGFINIQKADGTRNVQITANGDTYFKGGDVGIGTDDPTTELDVNAVSNESTITLRNAGTKKGAFQAQNSFGTILYSYGEPLKFSTHSGTSYAERLHILTSGEVSIGGFTPTASAGILQIAGGLRVAGSASASDTTTPYIYRTSGADNLNFATSGVERLSIKSGGQVLIGTNSSQSFNGVGQNHNLIVTGDSNDTDITDNHNAAITISNEDGTANNTAGLHFAREDTDGNPHYTGASVVAQFLETMNTGHYPKADLAFLTSTANNNAPSEKMRLKADGEVRLTSGGFVSKTSSLINLSVDTHGWSQNTFYDVIGSNVFDSYTDTFLVQFQWEHEGHGSPYLAYGNFLFTPTGANHTGAIGRTFQPVQCGHSFHGPTKYFEFRAYAAGAVRPGIQAVARGFSPANSNDYGYMRIKATRIASN